MREQFYIQGIQEAHARCERLEGRLKGIYKVLEEIIGKELLRGQALHKVLMDKALFTDAELKTALEQLVAEGKEEMKKMEEKAREEKAKAVELLVPSNANLNPPPEAPVVHPDTLAKLEAEQPVTDSKEQVPPTEGTSGQV